MEDVNEMLAEQQRELERIRKKRGGNHDTERVRQILNIAFMILAFGSKRYFPANIPTLGIKHSHPGNNSFPPWE